MKQLSQIVNKKNNQQQNQHRQNQRQQNNQEQNNQENNHQQQTINNISGTKKNLHNLDKNEGAERLVEEMKKEVGE